MTKVVLDTSAKLKGMDSLNKILCEGESLTPQLLNLFKFRYVDIAITADIEKAYIQISVDVDCRNVLSFQMCKDVFADAPEIVLVDYYLE